METFKNPIKMEGGFLASRGNFFLTKCLYILGIHNCGRGAKIQTTQCTAHRAAQSNHELLDDLMAALHCGTYYCGPAGRAKLFARALQSLKRTINQTFLEQSINPRSRSHCVNRIIYT